MHVRKDQSWSGQSNVNEAENKLQAGDEGRERERQTITRVKQCKWRRSITREKKAESQAFKSIAGTLYGMARKEGRKKKAIGIKCEDQRKERKPRKIREKSEERERSIFFPNI